MVASDEIVLGYIFFDDIHCTFRAATPPASGDFVLETTICFEVAISAA